MTDDGDPSSPFVGCRMRYYSQGTGSANIQGVVRWHITHRGHTGQIYRGLYDVTLLTGDRQGKYTGGIMGHYSQGTDSAIKQGLGLGITHRWTGQI